MKTAWKGLVKDGLHVHEGVSALAVEFGSGEKF